MRIERPENTVIVPVKGKRYVYTIAEKRYLKDRQYNVNNMTFFTELEIILKFM